MRNSILRKMLYIRRIEERIANEYSKQQMRCPTHLSIGQELPAVAICNALTHNDLAVSTHRAHAHYLAKGGDPTGFIAELYGKKLGCSGGFGGSMHLVDERVGFMGSTAIVGNSIPIGVGLGLAIQLEKNTQDLCVIFIGEAATETGAFLESANFAAVNKLPVIFVCENNLYSVYSDLSARQPKQRSLKALSEGLGLTYRSVETFDAYDCCEATTQIIEQARSNQQPYFIEFATYRHREHCGPNFDDDLGYRDEAEVNYWLSRDPLSKLIREYLDSDMITKIEFEINEELNDIFKVVEKEDFPELGEVAEFI
ncbi:thiamine pyrophosphate-dependent dehydrogenase E1 component subunit alpha [bacterium]|nr:thiamine pyrophosphate-dependent dehydrogenase E1 component subunit alpha [bacterium]